MRKTTDEYPIFLTIRLFSGKIYINNAKISIIVLMDLFVGTRQNKGESFLHDCRVRSTRNLNGPYVSRSVDPQDTVYAENTDARPGIGRNRRVHTHEHRRA